MTAMSRQMPPDDPPPPFDSVPALSTPASATTTIRPRKSKSTLTSSSSSKIPPNISLSAAIASAAKARTTTQPPSDAPVIRASLLAPRVAVILDVPRKFHWMLFAGRLISIFPAIFWGWRPAALLVDVLLPGGGEGLDGFPRMEVALASMWCFASGYLAFFFADCLMSRWLINYTPQATIVRLLSINAVNFFGTNAALKMSGAFYDIRLFLPAWIVLSAVLTGAYHVTHQKINIRKETVTSINVYSIASTISMVALLLSSYSTCENLPEIPIIIWARVLAGWALQGLAQVRASLRNS